MSRVILATLCLNEMEWLPKLYKQHKGWPGLVRWIFVESADRVYAETNPDLVSSEGLSVDGTTQYLQDLTLSDNRIMHIQHGISSHPDLDQGKVASRGRYLRDITRYQPEYVMVVDADEFYTHEDQHRISHLVQGTSHLAYRFPQRHIWRPRSVATQPLFQSEVTGGYWKIPHVRCWRYRHAMTYLRNHNWPEDAQGYLTRSMLSLDNYNSPQCIHMAFASDVKTRHAKHSYYIARGEGRNDRRQMYVDCRAAFETWKPGKSLPAGASVIPYHGPIPEVF